MSVPGIARSYHEATKHYFNRFAPSLGYLDWATQPDPFRRYTGAPVVELPRVPLGRVVPYEALYDGSAPAQPVSRASIAELLRCSMGLSAWKQFRGSRWALRVNPSSGNLHPTEAYVIHEGRVGHYAPREHLLEERCDLGTAAWQAFSGGREGVLVALTSIHWREAWKYGERAFRYCQHDAGHALAALRLAAAMLGWRLALLPRWSVEQIGAVTGTGEPPDDVDAEPEEPECLAVATPGDPLGWISADPGPLVAAAAVARWHGVANRLSAGHVDWPVIDRVARATRHQGLAAGSHAAAPDAAAFGGGPRRAFDLEARKILLQRRSALAFDGRSSLAREAFMPMLRRLLPGAPPWDAIPWPAQVHLVLFVHRVSGLAPGVYAWLRAPDALEAWRRAMRPEFLWEPVEDALFLLAPGDVTWPASRVSCDQDIAADGFFSLGMIARFDASLAEWGEPFYRQLYWECGMIGQVLYLEAEAAGARGTGIGCFYDDAVHELTGLTGTEWQSLYHFTTGMPVDDPRLTTEPGYQWEAD